MGNHCDKWRYTLVLQTLYSNSYINPETSYDFPTRFCELRHKINIRKSILLGHNLLQNGEKRVVITCEKKNFKIFANIIFVSNTISNKIYFNNEATTSLARAYKRPQFELSEKLACELLLTLPFEESRFSLWCNHVFNYLTLQINPFHLISLNVIMIIKCDKDKPNTI